MGIQASDEADDSEDVTTPKWDGIISAGRVHRERGSYSDQIADWDFYDDDGGHFPQEVYLRQGSYDTDPNDPEAEIIDVWRWESQQGGDVIESGQWTADEDEARDGGMDYAQVNNQEKPEAAEEDDNESEPDPPEDENDGEFDDVDVDAVFGANELGLSVSQDGSAITIEHEKIDTCDRTLGENSQGRFIHNDIFMLKKQYEGDGFGSEVFNAEVRGAKAAGFDCIETHGARRDGIFNGYYTWLTLGYDQSIDSVGGSLARRIKELVPGAQTMQDMMGAGKVNLTPAEIQDVQAKITSFAGYAANAKTKDMLLKKAAKSEFMAKDWWLANGEGLLHLKFDLHDGSRSLKIMDANLARKAAEKAGTPATMQPSVVSPAQRSAGQRAAATRLAREQAAAASAAAAGKPPPLTAGQRAAATRR